MRTRIRILVVVEEEEEFNNSSSSYQKKTNTNNNSRKKYLDTNFSFFSFAIVKKDTSIDIF